MTLNFKASVPFARDASVTINKLVILSKLDEKLERLSKNIIDSVDNHKDSMPEMDFSKYKGILITAFNASTLKRDIRGIISKKDHQKILEEIVSFLDHPLVKHIIEREEVAKSPDEMDEMHHFLDDLKKSPPTDERKLLIEHVDKIRNISSTVIEANCEIFQAVTWGMRRYLVSDQVMTPEQLKQIRLDRKKQIEPFIKHQMLISMLYAYKNTSDGDLKTYISLCETSVGKLANKFIQLAYQLMNNKVAKQLQGRLEAVFDSGHSV